MSVMSRAFVRDWGSVIAFFGAIATMLAAAIEMPLRLSGDDVANVNGTAIRKAELDERHAQLFGSDHSDSHEVSERQTTLNYLIDEELLIQYGERSRVLENDRALRNAWLQSAVLQVVDVSQDPYEQQRQLAALMRHELESSDLWVSPEVWNVFQLTKYADVAGANARRENKRKHK